MLLKKKRKKTITRHYIRGQTPVKWDPVEASRRNLRFPRRNMFKCFATSTCVYFPNRQPLDIYIYSLVPSVPSNYIFHR